jgi:tetratricopeptide (TPR) repeat protein
MKKNRLWLDMGLIFMIAILVRVFYINQLSHSYFFAPFKGGFDDYIYDNWARQILSGNWFGDGVIYIYRMPLYAYFLSFIYYLAGHSFLVVYIIQAVIGVLACLFVYFIGKKAFNRSTGLIGGILAALYGPFIFYSGMLVGETLCLLTTYAAIWLLVSFQDMPKKYFLFFTGVLMGISVLLRGNMLVAAVFIVVWLANLKKCTVSGIFLFLLGMALAVSPVAVRNYIKEKDFVPINASAGLNFYIGNAYGADGKYRVVDEVSNNPEEMLKRSIDIANKKGRGPLKPSGVSQYWLNQAIRSVSDNGVMFLVPLYIKKLILFWNGYEQPDIWDYYFFRQYIPVLKFLLVNFSLLAALAFAGMILGWPQRDRASVIYTFIWGYMFSLCLFFINSRYRIQVVPALCIFAGFTLASVRRVFKTDRARAIKAAVIFMAMLAFSNIAVEKGNFATSHNSLGILLKRDGKVQEAVKEYQKAIEVAPAYPSPYYNLGILYRDGGEQGLAAQYFKKALEADPHFSAAQRELRNITEED